MSADDPPRPVRRLLRVRGPSSARGRTGGRGLRPAAPRSGDDAGSTTDFAVSLAALVVVFLVVAQSAIYVYVGNIARAAAYEGARLAAEDGRGPGDGVARARELLEAGAGGYARVLRVTGSLSGGQVRVDVTGELPPLTPFAPRLPIDAEAAVFDEEEARRG